MGSDSGSWGSFRFRRCVSIHAPAWGATAYQGHHLPQHPVSIHAPAWGATRKAARANPANVFQFTLPHGERLGGRGVGGRVVGVSIHAPAWGATLCSGPGGALVMFQFTLPHGERPAVTVSRVVRQRFQFTLPHGERQPRDIRRSSSRVFQFTLPHGERRRCASTGR